ncbi:MAG: hypothetical protein II951_05005, partial [Bacteroidales bacterium]|nr:hypothetical protein [Bacteroidales bacterium]
APSLSDREREIMEYSARGMTVPQIAEKIFLSLRPLRRLRLPPSVSLATYFRAELFD